MTIDSINDEVMFFYFCEHIPPSRSMLGIVLIKYQGMYGYKCYFHIKIDFNILTLPPAPLLYALIRIECFIGGGAVYQGRITKGGN